MFKDFLTVVKNRGPIQAFSLLVSSFIDILFDLFSEINTSNGDRSPVELSNQFRMYQPSRGWPLRNILNKLNLNKTLGFVDFGCGKGRVLYILKEMGFEAVTGVEVIEGLIQVAKKNIPPDVILVNSDFRTYVIKAKEHYFYFYDPCNLSIVEVVFSNIIKSFNEVPRDIVIIYHNNLINDVSSLNNITGGEASTKSNFGNQFFIWKISK